MTWKEYLPLAEKTLSTQFHCENEFYQKILHAVIGSLTEVEEILSNYSGDKLITDPNKQGSIGEETADIFWYLSILFRELKLEESSFDKTTILEDENDPFSVLIEFTKTNLQLLDILKKKIYYNKESDINKISLLSTRMYQILLKYCFIYETDVSIILDKNIAKLKSRYGDKFSSDKAINRDLEAEKTILES